MVILYIISVWNLSDITKMALSFTASVTIPRINLYTGNSQQPYITAYSVTMHMAVATHSYVIKEPSAANERDKMWDNCSPNGQ